MSELAVPVLRQATEFACGPTCLAAVAQFHGRGETAEQLAVLARTTADGTDHAGMIDAARALGAQVIAGDRGTLAMLTELVGRGLPVIVGWWDGEQDHFSVIAAASSESVVMMDPYAGRTVHAAQAFVDAWYDFDGDDNHRVDGWYLALDYAPPDC
jgi:ABC-type bacteriocin/lantibiotic exporter with double-glycine peptidase domain